MNKELQTQSLRYGGSRINIIECLDENDERLHAVFVDHAPENGELVDVEGYFKDSKHGRQFIVREWSYLNT